jgi:hypothetical protein
MAAISLTDFIEYVTKVGKTKYTKVKQIKGRDEYHPSKDFWKPLREGVIEFHRNDGDKKELDRIAKALTDQKKLKLYPQLIKSYKNFLGRKKLEWFEPPSKVWRSNSLEVKINPELGLVINDQRHVIKLYFKSEKMSQTKVDLILLLMEHELKRGEFKDCSFAVLDVPCNKLFAKTKLGKEHLGLLEGEAMSFMRIWDSV